MNLDLAGFRAAVTPDRPAVHWDGGWTTYGAMNRRAERLAGRLQALGVDRFDRISILAHNHLAHLDLWLAAAKAAVVYAPLNPRLSPVELRSVTDLLRPRLLLHDAAHASVARGLGVPAVALEEYETWLGDPELAPDPGVGPEDPQMILLTGGTTGLPKGAVLPYRQQAANAAATVLSWGLREDDVAVQATPCFHAAMNALTTPLYTLGARVALMPRFEPGAYLRLVDELGATLLFMVPTMFQMLADHEDFAQADLSRVRWAISGGAPCPLPLRDAFAERDVRFKQGYGLTEAGVNCFAIDLDTAARKPWSVGRPILHTEAVVRRPDGMPADPGEVGELTLAGPHLFHGYFEHPEATADVLKDGWLWTGDLARVDDEGDLALVGRRKDLFISGGENVFPAEIAAALDDHPNVAACAVTGVPDARWGEVGLAAVVLREGAHLDADDVRAFLKERLASYKVPKHVRFMDVLPVSGAGKVLVRQLRDDFVAQEGAARAAEGSPA
ncbi:MAG: AMP-binding protein [Trueperaceae bacterium]